MLLSFCKTNVKKYISNGVCFFKQQFWSKKTWLLNNYSCAVVKTLEGFAWNEFTVMELVYKDECLDGNPRRELN